MGRPAQTSKGSGIAEFLRTWRLLFWTIGLALLFPLFYAEENWRGQRAWERHKRTLESGSISAANYLPPRVPDSDNFAMTPFLAPLFEYIPATPTGPVRWLDPKGFERATRFGVLFEEASQNVTPVRGSKSNSWLNTSADLAAWRSAFLKSTNAMVQSAISNTAPAMAAEGVLAALHEYEPVFEELRKASTRPHSRFNIYYEQADKPSILLPHLGVLRKLVLVLQLRASAELALGRADNAFETVKLMLHLTDVPRGEPFLISYLVRLAMFRLTLQPIAEGIPQWTPDQLETLQQKLQQSDFCRDAKRSLEAERIFLGHELIEYLRRSPNQYALLSGWANGGKNAGDSWDPAWLLAVAPQGWLYLEQLNYDLAFQRYVLPAIDPAQKRIDPAFTMKTAGELENFLDDSQAGLVFEHRWFASMALPSITNFAQKAAFGQVGVDLATIACALERYRRTNGNFPELLGNLLPEHIASLPHDTINGRPLKYTRLEDTYVLYSVGWNAVDDSGAVVPVRTGERDVGSREGDWVWHPIASPTDNSGGSFR